MRSSRRPVSVHISIHWRPGRGPVTRDPGSGDTSPDRAAPAGVQTRPLSTTSPSTAFPSTAFPSTTTTAWSVRWKTGPGGIGCRVLQKSHSRLVRWKFTRVAQLSSELDESLCRRTAASTLAAAHAPNGATRAAKLLRSGCTGSGSRVIWGRPAGCPRGECSGELYGPPPLRSGQWAEVTLLRPSAWAANLRAATLLRCEGAPTLSGNYAVL